MPHGHRTSVGLIVLLAAGGPAAGAPLFSLEDGGRTFVYRARPGDHPSGVAEMFGVPQEALDALLTANGIGDPSRIPAGFAYRIPNPVVVRTEALEAERARLARETVELRSRAETAEREAASARATAAAAETRAEGLAVWAARWPALRALVVFLALGLGAAVAVATAAVRRQQKAIRYAAALAHDLEDKRRAGLAERQESSKRILDLEARVRTLEVQTRPRVVISGRGA